MPRNTSVTLGEHFEAFVETKLKEGRFESKSEVVRAALRLLEEHEQQVDVLRAALEAGETSGPVSTFELEDFLQRVRVDDKNA